MSHYVYLTTLSTSKGERYYVGKHSWSGEGIDPKYVGSGNIVRNFIKKHGRKKNL